MTNVEGYPDDFEIQPHSQDEWDSYEKAKLKQGKASTGKITDYKSYKRNLVFRNLVHNFKQNTSAVISKATPILKDLAQNAATNSDSLVDGAQPASAKKKKGN